MKIPAWVETFAYGFIGIVLGVLIVGVVSLCVRLASPTHTPRSAALALTYSGDDQASCSGTAIGPYAVLGAWHCDDNKYELIKVNTFPVRIRLRLRDGHDHVIYLLDGVRFQHFARVRQRPLHDGEVVRVWGCPQAFYFLSRSGTYAGEDWVSGLIEVYFNSPRLQLFNYASSHGDSGAGIFDSKSEVVAVESAVYSHESLTLAIALPLQFTEFQLATARSFAPVESTN